MGAWEIVTIVLEIFGGMGTFLIGMRMLSENMTKLAHGKLKKMLNKTANSRFAGVGIGAAVTVLGQSSAFTTVMVVGLVNAGIMTLFQATAIIMGANIGTTLNAWVIALGGSDITVLFFILAAVGVLMMMFSKKERVVTLGSVIAAFGIIFVGLKFMSGALTFDTATAEGEAAFNAVSGILQRIANPCLLLLLGIVITALVQSSTAVNAIILTMVSSGLVIGGGGNAALYIIIGSNIGTCVTALISSLGASPNAKRAALIHFLFNLFGAIIFMVILVCWTGFADTVLGSVFPTGKMLFAGRDMAPGMQIALFHTLFNTVNTLLFLPFVKVFVWIAEHLVREKKQEEKGDVHADLYGELDDRLLRSPSVALGYMYQETGKVFSYAMAELDKAFDAFLNRDVSVTEEIVKRNAELAAANRKGVSYLVKLTAQSAALEDEKTVSDLHYVLNDIMRVGELADNVTKYTRHTVEDELVFSDEFLEMLRAMYAKIRRLYELTLEIFLEKDTGKLPELDALEDEIDEDRKLLVSTHIDRLNEGKCDPKNSSVFINLVGNLERAADHITYIAHSVEEGGREAYIEKI